MSDPRKEIDEVLAIADRYGLTTKTLAKELKYYLGLTEAGLYALLRRPTPKLAIRISLERWLQQRGRKEYPLRKEDYDPDSN